MKIEIISDKKLFLEVNPETTVLDLKNVIKDELNVPIDEQRLIANGKQLRNNSIVSHKIISLVTDLKGGSKWNIRDVIEDENRNVNNNITINGKLYDGDENKGNFLDDNNKTKNNIKSKDGSAGFEITFNELIYIEKFKFGTLKKWNDPQNVVLYGLKPNEEWVEIYSDDSIDYTNLVDDYNDILIDEYIETAEIQLVTPGVYKAIEWETKNIGKGNRIYIN